MYVYTTLYVYINLCPKPPDSNSYYEFQKLLCILGNGFVMLVVYFSCLYEINILCFV